jgi:hypothetical protein
MNTFYIKQETLMTSEERYIARICFENKVYKSNGNFYEELFTLVMQQRNPNFKQVKPQGSLGDKKNDGFDPETGTYYQVYAPENLSVTEDKAIKKVIDDFNGLKAFWPSIGYPIKSFYYVVNDKFNNVGPSVYKVIKKLELENPDITIKLFLSKDLEREFSSLDEDQMTNVIGVIPSADITMISIDVLHNVITHIMNSKVDANEPFFPLNPDMEEKIKFNGLSASCAAQLTTSLINTSFIDDYFSEYNNFMRDALRDRFNTFYNEARKQFDDANLIFADIYKRALPPNASRAHADAVMILMAYYFECCDIFESPEK